MVSQHASTASINRKTPAAIARPPTHLMPLRPGFLVVTEFSARGGVKFVSTGKRRATDGSSKTSTKFVDNPQLEKLTRAIMNGCYGHMQAHCAATPLGFITDADGLQAVTEALREPVVAAQQFNTHVAPKYDSDRRITVDFFPVPLNTKDERWALRLQRLIRERLVDLKVAMKTAHRDTVKMHFDRSRNIERITTGVHYDKVKAALDSMRDQRHLLSAAPPEKIDLAKFDFRKIDAAISYLE
jgi:hypothetical protein